MFSRKIQFYKINQVFYIVFHQILAQNPILFNTESMNKFIINNNKILKQEKKINGKDREEEGFS
ncbi:hypothetical protein A7Q09_06700 [Methylacidiphilum sp. Yel]|jgi:hypothetical protein|nr:hypothetical protein A7Q09_06700 [Methylacidiphilum sp. Yel]